jgi:hypothetical protein
LLLLPLLLQQCAAATGAASRWLRFRALLLLLPLLLLHGLPLRIARPRT